MQELIIKSNNFDADERSHLITHCNIFLHISNEQRQRLRLCLFTHWKEFLYERQKKLYFELWDFTF